MWNPDQDLVGEAVDVIERSLASGESADTADLLEALGMLRVTHSPQAARDALGSSDISARVTSFFEAEDFGSLTQAASSAMDVAMQLADADEEERATLCEQLRDAFGQRDRAQLVLEGTIQALRCPAELTIEQEANLEAFELLVRPQLFRLIPAVHFRDENVAWIAPPFRSRFWWWSEGLEIPAEGLDHLSTAAQVLARFPDARARLDELVAAEERLCAELLKSTGGAEVVSLRELIEARKNKDADRMQAAAYTGPFGLMMVYDTAEVSWTERDEMVVDIVAERESTQPPTLKLHPRGTTVTGKRDDEEGDRWFFEVHGLDLDSTSLTLRVPGAGEETIPFTVSPKYV